MLNWFSGKRILVVIGFLMGISGVGLTLAANRTGSTNLNPTTTTRVQAGSITTTTIGNSSLGPGPALSAAVRAENLRPGTTSWRISGPQIRNSISGYASTVSIFAGGSFKIYVSTIEPNFNVTAYRMGWYGGDLARMVWQSPTIKGLRQPSCPVTPANNTVECSWRPSLTIHTNQNWFPGDYLLLLTGTGHQQSYIPITIKQVNSNSAYLVINSVTTWEAYNTYGGYSLYLGPTGASSRATKVSFDRPYAYTFGQGAADFIGNELPLVSLVERMGLNVSYVTDVDLQEYPGSVLNHSAILSLGHDEYYSPGMRAALTSALHSGTNLMFLGANAIFRRIRFESSPLGPYRIEVNYRNPYLDPLFGKNNALVTANWPSFPDAQPESSLIGIQYQCNPVHYPMVITDPSSWVFANSNLSYLSRIPNLVGSEFDAYDPQYPTPAGVQILAHSPVLCRNVPYFSDMTYYVAASGAGVFATGTNLWVAALSTSVCVPVLQGCPIAPVVTITQNILSAFGSGPSGRIHPAVANASEVLAHPPVGPLTPVTTTTTTSTSSTTSTTLAQVTTTTYPGETTTTVPVAGSTTTTSVVGSTTTSTTFPATTTTTTTSTTSTTSTTVAPG